MYQVVEVPKTFVLMRRLKVCAGDQRPLLLRYCGDRVGQCGEIEMVDEIDGSRTISENPQHVRPRLNGDDTEVRHSTATLGDEFISLRYAVLRAVSSQRPFR